MDPDVTLQALIEALGNDDRAEAIETCDALAEWLRGGGFIPQSAKRLLLV